MTGSSLPTLPVRDPRGHKGTFGTVTVVGGCAPRRHDPTTMLGGPCLSAIAALRAGAGLARLAVPEPLMTGALTIAPSATGLALPVNADGDIDATGAARALRHHATGTVMLAGPGLGTGDGVRRLLRSFFELDACALVLDADALNALGAMPDAPDLVRTAAVPIVLTPHIGEFRRLASAIGITGEARSGASDLAQRFDATIVLKSSTTVIASPSTTHTVDAPNPVLATGGSGDVLAGVIAGLLAQHGTDTPVHDLAHAGVVAHAAAADAWCAEHQADGGLLAMELADRLPPAIAALRRSS
ncbi:MAG: NAD(P)H-hydrate dehydratase [Planctomycetota bacterium]